MLHPPPKNNPGSAPEINYTVFVCSAHTLRPLHTHRFCRCRSNWVKICRDISLPHADFSSTDKNMHSGWCAANSWQYLAVLDFRMSGQALSVSVRWIKTICCTLEDKWSFIIFVLAKEKWASVQHKYTQLVHFFPINHLQSNRMFFWWQPCKLPPATLIQLYLIDSNCQSNINLLN